MVTRSITFDRHPPDISQSAVHANIAAAARVWPLSARIAITVSVLACGVDVVFPPFRRAGSQGGHHGQLNINITRPVPA